MTNHGSIITIFEKNDVAYFEHVGKNYAKCVIDSCMCHRSHLKNSLRLEQTDRTNMLIVYCQKETFLPNARNVYKKEVVRNLSAVKLESTVRETITIIIMQVIHIDRIIITSLPLLMISG